MAVRNTFSYSFHIAWNFCSSTGVRFGSRRQSLLVIGLIFILKSMSTPESTLLGIEDVDRGGTCYNGEDEKESSGGSGWVNKLLFFCLEDAKGSFMVVTVSILFRSALWEAKSIPSASMYPTILNVSYLFKKPEFSDIVIFKVPPTLVMVTARMMFHVAREGDWVEVRDGKLFVNDDLQEEEFVSEPMSYGMEPTFVSKGYVFVLGDNRNKSFDSHNWGPLPIENIVGRSLFRYWPPIGHHIPLPSCCAKGTCCCLMTK
ncbi:hypothetical protein N665_0337s0008 [Sinapis alba]|nr:hypothetical protein N665_0337s0008 [Sinapis alba]